MNEESIHSNIKEKLDFYIAHGKIPNIVFHGEAFHGKKHLLRYFIKSLYQGDSELIKTYVMFVNCAHGKGIKFIRDDVKFFAKTHMHCDQQNLFKSIVFLNADHLTIEAQSALRRCIELYSHSTRFFIVLVDKYKLLKPILSRFCEIYVPVPRLPLDDNEEGVGGRMIAVQTLGKPIFVNDDTKLEQRAAWLAQYMSEDWTVASASSILYEKGYSALELMDWLKNKRQTELKCVDKHQLQFMFEKFRREIRNEELLLSMILHFVSQSNTQWENLSFM